MFITELLEFIPEDGIDMIFENLGNLKQIRKDFLKGLDPRNTAPIEKNLKLMPDVGKDSEISIEVVKNSSSAIEKLEGSVIALVIRIGDGPENQIAMISKSWVKGKYDYQSKRSNDEVVIIIDGKWILNNMDQQTIDKIKKKVHTIQPIDKTTGSKDSIKNGILTPLLKGLKDKGLNPEMVLISIDKKRLDTHDTRVNNQKGKIPINMNHKELSEFSKSATQALMDRLDQYKASKSVDVENMEEFLKVIIEKGYLDKIKINGFVYEYKDSRIDFNKLRAKNQSKIWDNEKSYIEYKIDTDQEKWKKISREHLEARKKAKENGKSEAELDAIDEEWYKRRPPGEIKIMLKLDGGKIVPSGDIKLGDRYF